MLQKCINLRVLKSINIKTEITKLKLCESFQSCEPLFSILTMFFQPLSNHCNHNAGHRVFCFFPKNMNVSFFTMTVLPCCFSKHVRFLVKHLIQNVTLWLLFSDLTNVAVIFFFLSQNNQIIICSGKFSFAVLEGIFHATINDPTSTTIHKGS